MQASQNANEIVHYADLWLKFYFVEQIDQEKRMDVPRTINLSVKKFTTKVPPIRKYIKVASGLNPSKSKKLEHVLNVTVQINNPPEVAEAVESGETVYMSQQDGQNLIEGNYLA